MYREAGAHRVYFNPEAAFSTHHNRVWTNPVFAFGPKFRRLGQPKNKAIISTRKCMLEDWLSLGFDNGEIEVASVELLNMSAKNLSSKHC